MAPIFKLALALALASTSATAHLEVRQLGSHALAARKADADFNSNWLQSNYKNGDAAPGAQAGDAGGQGIVIDAEGGGDDDSQVPWCNTAFVGSAAVNGSADAGWQALPQLTGFDLDRSLEVEGAIQPVYIEKKDASLVKRVIIAQPGKPRDSWKYVNLFRNALNCAVANESLSTVLSDVMVVAPAWLSTDDAKAGAALPTDLFFTNGGWSTGGQSRGPGDTSVSSFRVMDLLINKFFDKSKYPQVSSVIVGGHSLGASFSQRYAFLRRPDANQDSSISFWVGNPGAYVWVNSERPITPNDTSCDATKDLWAYGVGGDLPAYRKSDTAATPANLYSTYASRRVQYALGLKDDGPGDTHCEAQYEGDSHLQRGQNMEKALESLPGGKPSTHTFTYIPDTSHQDYKMIAAIASQSYLFSEGLTTPRNSSLDSSSSSTKGKGSTSGSSSTPSAADSTYSTSKLVSILGAATLAILGLAI